MNIADYRLNLERVESGTWFDFEAWVYQRRVVALSEPSKTLACVKLARFGSTAYNAVYAKEVQANIEAFRKPSKENDGIIQGALLKAGATLVLDMANMFDGDRKLTAADAPSMMTDQQFPHFKEFVFEASKHDAAYRTKLEVDVLGN